MTIEQEEMFFRNQGLVGKVVKNVKYGDYDYLFNVGLMGLVKGIKKFNVNAGFKESSYLYRCVQNEIYMYFRKERKHIETVSYDNLIESDSDISFQQILEDKNMNIERDLLNKETTQELYRAIEMLNEKEKIVICSLYELNGFERKTQKGLAKELNLTQSYISRIHNKVIKKLRKMLGEIE